MKYFCDHTHTHTNAHAHVHKIWIKIHILWTEKGLAVKTFESKSCRESLRLTVAFTEKYYIYVVLSITFQPFFVQAFKIVVNSWKFTVIARHLMKWLTDLYRFRFKRTATSGIGIHLTKSWLSQMVNFKNATRTLKERYAIKLCFKLRKNATETYWMLQTAFWPSCMNQASVFQWHKRFKEGRESVRDKERCRRSKEVNTPELIG